MKNRTLLPKGVCVVERKERERVNIFGMILSCLNGNIGLIELQLKI